MDVDELLAEPRRRRLWLLTEAMACASLDLALELARAADDFVVGGAGTAHIEPISEANAPKTAECRSAAPPCPDHEEPKRGLASLTPERREELLDRIACGETNAALAVEFGLPRKQIQGLRMGAARRIALRRPAGQASEPRGKPEKISASIEDVVRYLRQQDDVVVSEGGNRFLVNGRFHLDPAELLAKANRIRERHDKPLFRLGEPQADSLPGPIPGADRISAYHPGPVRPETQH